MSKERLVPRLRFEEFSKTWEKKTLGELGNVAMNKRIFKNQTSDKGEIPFYKIGTFGKEPDAYISRELFNEYKSKYSYPKRGDILISASGSIGRTVEYKGKDEYFQDSNIVWLNHNGRINNNFIKQFYKIVNWHGLEGSTIKRLYNSNILNTGIVLPSLKEQEKIGFFFGKIDEMISLQQSKLSKVKDIKSAYLSEMFPKEGEKYPKKRFEGFTEPWTAKKLGSLLDYEQPTNYLVKSDSYDDSYLTPVLTAGKSFLLGYTNETEGIYKADNNNGVIIFDDFTTSSHFVDFDFKVKSSAMKFLRTNQSNFNLYFLYNLLTSINYSPESHERHWISIFSEFEVLVPTKKEQEKIAQLFKNLDNQISIEEKKLAKLEKLKQAYLNDMFV